MQQALQRQGGTILAIAVDPPEDARKTVKSVQPTFPVLCDTTLAVTKSFGLLHPAGGPGKSDIAIPAQMLIARDGRIAWRHVAGRVPDRPDPALVLQQVNAL